MLYVPKLVCLDIELNTALGAHNYPGAKILLVVPASVCCAFVAILAHWPDNSLPEEAKFQMLVTFGRFTCNISVVLEK